MCVNDVVHPSGSYRYCYTEGSCTTGEKISKRILNLPVSIHVQLTEKQLQKLKLIFVENGIK
jgi:hypothetical protein